DKQKALARVYLAASLMALEKEDEAYVQLEELARLYPEQRVDPALFPPELVELELRVRNQLDTERRRQEAEQAERNRIAAAEDAERRRREQEEAARNQPVVEVPREEVRVPVSAPPVATFRLRAEASSFLDLSTPRAWGLGAGVTVGTGMLEASLRGLIAPKWGLELDAGLVFGSGVFQPRVVLRGTAALGLEGGPGIGLGGAVGARLALSPQLTALADFGIERLVSAPSGYKPWLFMASAGIGFNLF
ncbi:MAG TPA: hypothetical protein VEU33_08305, partial [Archangium sp.]|nr:hypothetical protein [Archangium sp.]